jgi:energy-coupling factor transporter ATP-binding protein EcfA2
MIRRVETNIKSANGPKTIDIAAKNLIVGPNESGKSTIVEAIQLALSGSVYGILLRPDDVKRGEDLSSLIPGLQEEAYSKLTFADGSSSQWSIGRGKRAKFTGPRSDVALPVATMRSILKTESRATKFLFETFFPDSDLLKKYEAAGSSARKHKAKMKGLIESLPHLSSAIDVSNESMYSKWQELFTALRFEYMRKIYRDNPPLREHCILELDKLGTTDELKSLRGSAQIHEEIEVMLSAKASSELAVRIRGMAQVEMGRSKVCEDTQLALIDEIRNKVYAAIPGYVQRINSFMPDGDHVELSLEPGKIRYGLKRSDGLHRAMSGSAEARVLAAMAAASVRPDQRAILILDDRMWDPDTLSRTMDALNKTPCQVIIMSTIKPKGRRKKDWHYIEIS